MTKENLRGAEVFIFDLDGTLLNTIDDLAEATNRALEAEGLPVRALDEVRSFVGNGVAVLLEKAAGGPEAATEALRKAFDRAYAEGLWRHTVPYEGVPELLRRLKADGKKLAVLTNKPDGFAKPLTEHFFPGFFLDVRGQRDGFPRKPDPEALLSQLRDLGFDPASVVYVGDSDVDVKTAKAAGVISAAVTWGFRTKDVLKALEPDFLIDRAAEFFTD